MADQSRSVNGNLADYAATVYPYSPPPNAPENQDLQYARLQRLLILGYALGVVVFILCFSYIIVVMRPSFTSQRYPQYRVETLTLSNFNISFNSLISGDWDANFTVRNPNSKVTLHYDHIKAFVFYKSVSISMTTVTPFVQGAEHETSIRVRFTSLMASVDRDSINSDWSNGVITFDVRMMVRVKLSAWGDEPWFLKVNCSDLPVAVSSKAKADGYRRKGSRGDQPNVGALVGRLRNCTAVEEGFF